MKKKNVMKMAVSSAMAAAMVLSLAACGSTASTESKTSEAASEAATEAAATEAAATEAASETASAASDVEWPTQPVNVVCPAKAGGGTDMILRLFDEYFTKLTGQSLVINNVTGVSGYEITKQADPDGYNYILGTTTIFTSEDDGSLGYDYDDYAMVSFDAGVTNTCIAVLADSEYETFNDIVDKAKADVNSVTGGITMSGQPFYFTTALNKYLGDILYTVDVGNTSERNAALLGGQVDYIVTNYSSCAAYVESGDFRVIAMDGEERYEMAPDVPTFKEQGIDFSFVAQPMVWLAPADTDPAICEKFNEIICEIYSDPEFIQEYKDTLSGVPGEMESVEDSLADAEAYKQTMKSLGLY